MHSSVPIRRACLVFVVCGLVVAGGFVADVGADAGRTTPAVDTAAGVVNVGGATAPVGNVIAGSNAAPMGPPAVTTGPSAATTGQPAGEIVELYPNPTTPQDHGEYALVEIQTPGEWTLTDGEGTADLSGATGRIAVTRHPTETAAHTNATTLEAPGRFRLADAGETLELRRDGVVVDRVSYETAPESHRWRVDTDPRWQPDGFEPRGPTRIDGVSVEAFVLPDSPDAPIDAIAGATDRLYLAAYTLSDRRVADALLAAHDRGATVRVLVDGGPVGGMSDRQAALLDELTAAGIEVRVLTGDRARFRYQHAKYAVADDRVVVLTENWKPSGVGGAANRGWGLRADSPATADAVAAVFAHDTTWRDTPTWDAVSGEIDTVEAGAATGSFPTNHPPLSTTADSVSVVVAPDNAADEIEDLLNETDEELLITQPQLGDDEFRLLQAAVRAADRGVSVRILLDSTWYVADENRAMADALAERAADDDSSLSVRLADGGTRFERIHSKGIVADDTAVVGSLNWNTNSAENNRELALIVDDDAVAAYYREVFVADWRGNDGPRELPTGIVVVGLGAVAAAALLASRRLDFVGRDG